MALGDGSNRSTFICFHIIMATTISRYRRQQVCDMAKWKYHCDDNPSAVATVLPVFFHVVIMIYVLFRVDYPDHLSLQHGTTQILVFSK